MHYIIVKFYVKHRKDKISRSLVKEKKIGRRRGERTRSRDCVRVCASVWQGVRAPPTTGVEGGNSGHAERGGGGNGESLGGRKGGAPKLGYWVKTRPREPPDVGHPARDGPRRRGCTWASRAERERAKAPALAIPGVTPIAWASAKVRDGGAPVR